MGKSLIRPCRCRSLRQHTRRYSSLYLGVRDGTRAMPRSSMLRSPLTNEPKGPCFRWSFIEFPLEFCNRNDGPEVVNTSKKRSNLRHFKLLGMVVKILKVTRSTRRDTRSARFFYAGNYDIPKILPCLLPWNKWHPRRSTCCSSTEMFSFLPAFKNILVHLTTLAVKIPVTNQTGKLFELPVAPVGFTPPYPAWPYSFRPRNPNLNLPFATITSGGLDPNTYHIPILMRKTPRNFQGVLVRTFHS